MNRTIARWLDNVDELASKVHVPREEIETILKAQEEELKQRRRNKTKAPAPAGSISINKAARKYHVHNPTICGWIKRGWVTVMLRTPNWTYISEADVARIVAEYKKDPGMGKHTVRRALAETTSN
jgi:hypothetical protein